MAGEERLMHPDQQRGELPYCDVGEGKWQAVGQRVAVDALLQQR